MIGTKLGPYEITAKLGEGGMGEVYRAHDTKLKRDVAIKVLPAAFTEDKERLARFEREAQLLAQLQHPNIASIYGLEESEGVRALVMELVEGPTLAERMEHGPLPFNESLSISLQIAQALEEAHEKGIVHRDLKPQNVKASIEGKVKVLDFGLAKAMDSSGAGSGATSASQLAQSPTLTFGATQMGMILGTAAYMSPEQAAGKTVDRRADIWAFGVVFWEMLSGRRLFEAETVPETLGAVFRQEIDFGALPGTTPPAVRRLVERCLERDPKLRLRDIGEARIALEEARGGARGASTMAFPASGSKVPAPEASPRALRASWLPWTLTAIAVLAAVVLGLRPQGKIAPALRLVTIGIAPPAEHVLAAGEAPLLDLARDGSAVAFEAEGAGGRQLYLRRLDRTEIAPIPGTEGATQPFFSPDGRSLGFFANGKIRRALLDGGAAVDLIGVNAYRGAVWLESGWIVFTQTYSSGLSKVRESGGRAEVVTTIDVAKGERTHRWPAAIPGSPWLLFSVGKGISPNSYDDARIDAVNLESGERKTVFDGAWMARFAPPSTLLVQRRTSLLALDFDPRTATVTGDAKSVLENAGGEASSGAAYFAAGAGGTLAYVPTDALSDATGIVLVDPAGRVDPLPLPERRYWYPRFSPDGRSLAIDIGSGQGEDDEIWRVDLATRGLSRVTFAGGSALPAWSPDGKWLAYTGNSGSRVKTIFRKRVDGTGEEEAIFHGNDLNSASDWTKDGLALIVGDLPNGLLLGLFHAPLDGSPPRPISYAPGGQYSAALDPSGRFLAYTSVESGVDEIFVTTFPEGGGKWQVSTEGGQLPVWSRDGRRLLFVKDGAIHAAAIDVAHGFHAGEAKLLQRGPYVLRTAPFRNFDVGPGDVLALVARRTDVTASRQLEVLVGWQAKLNATAPR